MVFLGFGCKGLHEYKLHESLFMHLSNTGAYITDIELKVNMIILLQVLAFALIRHSSLGKVSLRELS